jgi:hypothetical protein
MESDRIPSTGYPREGYNLDLGALWEIPDTVCDLRDLSVVANAAGIRIRDVYCGEWEMAESSAVRLTVSEARQLADSLQAAADKFEQSSDFWRIHANQADPSRALAEAQADRAFDDSLARWSEDPPSVTA